MRHLILYWGLWNWKFMWPALPRAAEDILWTVKPFLSRKKPFMGSILVSVRPPLQCGLCFVWYNGSIQIYVFTKIREKFDRSQFIFYFLPQENSHSFKADSATENAWNEGRHGFKIAICEPLSKKLSANYITFKPRKLILLNYFWSYGFPFFIQQSVLVQNVLCLFQRQRQSITYYMASEAAYISNHNNIKGRIWTVVFNVQKKVKGSLCIIFWLNVSDFHFTTLLLSFIQ